jgi:hypothetical protein
LAGFVDEGIDHNGKAGVKMGLDEGNVGGRSAGALKGGGFGGDKNFFGGQRHQEDELQFGQRNAQLGGDAAQPGLGLGMVDAGAAAPGVL